MTGESFGSTAMEMKPGLRDLRTSVTPVIVPPVPTADTSTSTLPSVSAQISLGGRAAVHLGIRGIVELLRNQE